MGGSGGSIGQGWNPSEMAQRVRETEKQIQGDGFRTKLSNFLADLLSRSNNRDHVGVQRRLDEIFQSLEGVLADRIEQIFGGSVAKHTYVDGLSDIDCLLIIDKKDLDKNGPKATLTELRNTLNNKLSGKAEVTAGEMAVTVRYADGMEIQLLPAARQGDTLRIPSARGADKWSLVNPRKFNESLTKYNAQCDGKLVPTIKLAKAIISQLPDAQKLSGYHVESLAIDAFKNYSGTKTAAAMLPHFFEHAKTRIQNPMTDKSGQSVHVDEYMGSKNSTERKNASHILGRISKRIANASAVGSIDQWKEIFGVDE